MGPYAQSGERLLEHGYAAIPIIPGTKRPGFFRGGQWIGLNGWESRFDNRLPSASELQIWSAGETGVGLVTGQASGGTIAIDIDTDDAAIEAALSVVLPTTSIKKKGAKGETLFYHSPDIHQSHSWDIDGKRVVDLIGPGRQTVLPPSIHPDTGRPYVWSGIEALEDIAPQDLPPLPAGIVEKISEALRPFGYAAKQAKPEATSDPEDSPHRRINEAALADLDSWVPALQLYRCRRTRRGYQAVPIWRASSTGRPPEKRHLNLSIVSEGIRDFGADQGYTPLNLVMAAHECDLDTAWRFLSGHLGWADGPTIKESHGRAEEATQAKQDNQRQRFTLIPFERIEMSTAPAYLIKDLIPRTGLVVIWGPPKCGKSFLVTTLALYIALGWTYREHRTGQGAVVYLALEGQSGFGKRIEAFRQRYMAEQPNDPVPFYLVVEPTNLIKEHPALIRCIQNQIVAPALVVIDTLNRSLVGSESKDEDMAAYIRAAQAVSQAFECAVVIIHHCGVDSSRPRGHTSLPGAVDVQIEVEREDEIVKATVEYAKDGPEGEVLASRLETVDLGIDADGDLIRSCVAIPVDPDEATGVSRKTRADLYWQKSVLYKCLLNALAEHGVDMRPYGPAGLVVRAVDRETLRQEFYRSYIGDDRKVDTLSKAFRRALTRAQSEERIGVRVVEEVCFVWSALPGCG